MTQATYISLDLETTGFDPERDEIIEVAAVKFRADKVVDIFQTLVRPNGALPYRVEALTGITARELRKAPPFEAVIADLLAFAGSYPIVGQSVGGDLRFLARWGIELANPVYDTHDLSRILLPTLPTRGLAASAAHLGITFTNKHRALPDCMAAKDVFLALRERALALDPRTLTAIINLGAGSGWTAGRFFEEVLRERLGSAAPARRAAPEATEGLGAFTEALIGARVAAEPARSLQPSAAAKPLDVDALAGLLGEAGPLAAVLPDFEYRAPQVEMLRRTADTLNRGGELFVEAGTGTGKSLAYLLPALVYAVQNGTPVVVSTNTINLQEQLMQKDIPGLVRALRLARERRLPGADAVPDLRDLRVALLKGRANYLCLRRWENVGRSALAPEEAVTAARVLVWLTETQTGDRAELNLAANEAGFWNRVSAQADEGGAASCSFQRRGLCFLQRARRTAENAHLVVTNHALLVSDAAGEGGVLPDYRHLIVDEAHHLEDVATDQFGFRVSSRDLNELLNRLSAESGVRRYQGFFADIALHLRNAPPGSPKAGLAALAEEIHGVVAAVRARLTTVFSQLDAVLQASNDAPRNEYGRRLRITRQVRMETPWVALEQAWEDAARTISDTETQCTRFFHGLSSLGDAIPRADDLLAELSATVTALTDLRLKLTSAISAPADDMVYWLTESSGREPPAVNAAPVEVGTRLAERLFEPRDAVVLTSATLQTAGSFAYLKGRLGLPKAREEALPSPFDYRRSTLVYVPLDFPEPERPGYAQALETALIDLVRATRGRALVLFTSYAALQAAHRGIRGPLERDKILVLAHGQDGSATQLLASFRTTERCVLLGTTSFWEGVDVVGEALSLLVITRLPFAVPTDPVVAARSELFADPFREYSLPQAILRFRQGFGRLIRSRTDRGALVVLDRRVSSRSYGASFLQSLPDCTFERGPSRSMAASVKAWLEKRN